MLRLGSHKYVRVYLAPELKTENNEMCSYLLRPNPKMWNSSVAHTG